MNARMWRGVGAYVALGAALVCGFHGRMQLFHPCWLVRIRQVGQTCASQGEATNPSVLIDHGKVGGTTYLDESFDDSWESR